MPHLSDPVFNYIKKHMYIPKEGYQITPKLDKNANNDLTLYLVDKYNIN